MSGNSTISMSANQQLEIEVPVDPETRQGVFPKHKDEEVRVNGEDRKHEYGFVSENDLVGSITPVAEGNTIKILYKHLQNMANRIYFFTAHNSVSIISIVSMPIHDHSSIHQGGPAYGSYAYDKIVEEETEPEA